jgi:probable rRNA maturation factor
MPIVIANRQRTRKINARLLRQITVALLAELEISEAQLGINLVGAREMALVNETFLQHAGPTDVITFDHRDCESEIHGELFICVDEAVAQAKIFKTGWQPELVRYVVHGVLHLAGHDDLKPQERRRMKRAENRLVGGLSKKFSLAQIGDGSKLRA